MALLQVLDIVSISFDTIWIIFLIVIVVGYGYEYLQKEKTGSYYVK